MEEEVYEVDRIIGRRISIARKIEYLIYWKGYDIDECSWSSSSDLDCPDAVSEFDERCFRHRKARQTNATVESIDRFTNEGLATLVDVGQQIYANGQSPFQDEMDDFMFTGDASAQGTPQLGAAGKSGRPLLVASHGWNRMAREPLYTGRIAKIRGMIDDMSGLVYYLSEWDDAVTTWEAPRAFGGSMRVLSEYENMRYMQDRRILVKRYRRSKVVADPSLVATREPKYMLEKTPARDGRHNAARSQGLLMATPSKAKTPGSWFDLGTSVLLGAETSSLGRPINEANSLDKPIKEANSLDTPVKEEAPLGISISRTSSDTPLSDTLQNTEPRTTRSHAMARKDSVGSSSGVSDIALSMLYPEDQGRKRQKAVCVYIDHVEGSEVKRRRRIVEVSEPEDEEMAVAERPSMLRATDTKCGFCMVDVSVAVGGAQGRRECSECGIAYHDRCFAQLAARLELGAAYIAALAQAAPTFVCWFCREYAMQAVDEYITWRVGGASLGSATVSLGRVDVAVKWKNMSYRHLSWVPLVWLSTTRRSPTLRTMKVQVQMGARAPLLAERVSSEYCQPEYIIGAKAAEKRSIERRRRQLAESGTKVPEDAWVLFTSYDAVWVAWKGLDISNATWEAPPSPLADADDFMQWHDAFVAWRRAEMVSLGERRGKRVERVEYAQQPAFVAGGVLKGYQVAGAQWLLQRWAKGESAVLADEMGMGKTIQTIAFLLMAFFSTVPDAEAGGDAAVAGNLGTFPFLVVVPTTLVDNWAREFRTWGPALVVAQLSGRAASRDVQLEHTLFRRARGRRDLKCHVVLTSYEALNNGEAAEAMAGVAWQAVVVDEGHRLKNDQTKTFQTLRQFRTRARVVLTGTPLQNDLRELHSVMSFVDPSVFRAGDDAMLSADTPADVERTKAAVRPYILRRTKADMPSLVPPRYEVILPVSMTGLQRQLYRATLTRNVALLRDIATALHANEAGSDSAPDTAPGSRLRSGGGNASAPSRPKKARIASLNNILMEVRRIVSHPYCLPEVEPEFPTEQEKHVRLIDACGKLKLLHTLLPELRARGHRVLLFAQFKDTLSIIEDYLQGEGIGCERIDGDTPSFLRQARVSAFNAPGSPNMVFLSTTRTGGLGLNLTSADVVIIYDCDFNPHVDLQAMGRAHRIGQTKPVYVFKLVTQDSAEERIVEVATRKLLLDHLVIQSMHSDAPAEENTQQPGQVEQALRHGASLLFEASAEERAEERAVVYDAARVQALLDQCRSAVEAEQQRASAPADFSRVWTLDRAGELSAASAEPSAEDEPVDVWAQLLDRAGAEAQPQAPQLSSEDVNGRLLRARRHKVDYAVGEERVRRAAVDDDFVLNDEDDAEGVPAAHAPKRLEPLLVSKDDLLSIVKIHRRRLIATYASQDQAEQPMPPAQAREVKARFEAAAQGRSPQPGAVPGSGSPALFFPIPANLRLRQNTQLPGQTPQPGGCPMCVDVPTHGRGFCPFICDPAFIAAIRAIKHVPNHWRHPYFHNFVTWYTTQYLWFVLGHAQGEAVHRANAALNPAYAIDAAGYLPEVRSIRSERTRMLAEKRQRTLQQSALAEHRQINTYAAFYATFEPPPPSTAAAEGAGVQIVPESPRAVCVPERQYSLDKSDSVVFRRFIDMLAGESVDLAQRVDLAWLEGHLKWLCGYRSSLLTSGRGLLGGQEYSAVYERTSGLRFISMRVEQVRRRIAEVKAGKLRPDAVEPTQPAVAAEPRQAIAPKPIQPAATSKPMPVVPTAAASNTAPLTSAELHSYVQKLGKIKAAINKPVVAPDAGSAADLQLMCGIIEQTRNYCATSMANAEPRAPILNKATKLIGSLVHKHDEKCRAGNGDDAAAAAAVLQASRDVNAACMHVWTAVRNSVKNLNSRASSASPASAGTPPNGPLSSVSASSLPMPASAAAAASLNGVTPAGRPAASFAQNAAVSSVSQPARVSSPLAMASAMPHRPSVPAYAQQSLAPRPVVSAAAIPRSAPVQLPSRVSIPSRSADFSGASSSGAATPVYGAVPAMASAQGTMRSASSFNYPQVSLTSAPAYPARGAAGHQHASSVSGYPGSQQSSPVLSTNALSPAMSSALVSGSISSALVSGAQRADMLALQRQGVFDPQQFQQLQLYQQQQQQQFSQQQQYYNALAKPSQGSPSSFMMTPPDSSVYYPQVSQQQQQQVAYSTAGQAHPGITSSYDLACLLCDSPGHRQSSCPSRGDIGALTRRRVAVESNMMLAPGIRETTLSIIDQYIQAIFTKR